ncbi:MAG: hypothetical protein ACR2PG_19655 [Hyphomicrobiaceae bacterium]
MGRSRNPHHLPFMFRVLLMFVQCSLLVVIELVMAILIYIYLALYHLEAFGALVRISKHVLDTLTSLIERLVPDLANQVYATILGELGPKAMLLLLTGLVVGAGLRLITWCLVQVFRGRIGAINTS